MTAPRASPGPLGFEAFGAATGLAVVVGALAVLVPGFAALAVALVALAVAGWAAGRPQRATLARRPGARAAAFATLGLGVAVYLDPARPAGAAATLVLGLALVPLWLLERPRRRGPGGRGR